MLIGFPANNIEIFFREPRPDLSIGVKPPITRRGREREKLMAAVLALRLLFFKVVLRPRRYTFMAERGVGWVAVRLLGMLD
jgi:hypothetical protein